MSLYEVSARSTVVTGSANAPLFALRAVTRRLYIYDISLFAVTAATTSGAIGLVRSTALGTGALTSVTGQPFQPEMTAGTGVLVTAWATAVPTISATTIFRRWAQGVAIGNGIIWSWPSDQPFEIPGSAAAASELVFVNLQGTAPGTFDITIRYDE